MKNLFEEAEELLLGLGLREREAKTFLDPAERLLPEKPFWKGQKDDLGLVGAQVSSTPPCCPCLSPGMAVVSGC